MTNKHNSNADLMTAWQTPAGQLPLDVAGRLARIQNLQNQIEILARYGKVDAARVKFATGEKYSDDEISATLSMMTALGLV